MNEGLLSGVEYWAPLKAYRKRVKIWQWASQYLWDAVVLGTTDNITGQTTRSQGAAPQTYRQDFVIQVPVTKGLKWNPVSSTAVSLTIPNGDIEWGNLRGAGAIDLQYYRDTATKVASGTSAVALGGNNTASGSASVSIWQGNNATYSNNVAIVYGNTAANHSTLWSLCIWDSNTCSGYWALVGKSNTVAASNWGYVLGISNTVNWSGFVLWDTNTVAFGSVSTTAIGYWNNSWVNGGTTSIAIGRQNTSSATMSSAIGREVTANSANGFATWYQSTTSWVIGKRAHSSGQYTSLGDNQYWRYILKYRTTDNILTPITTNGSAFWATNIIVLPNYSVFSFFWYVTAFRKGSEWVAAKVFKVEWAIRRWANAADTVLVWTPTVSTVGESSSLWYSVGCSADTTNWALWIYVTWTSAHSVQWVATIQTVENTYA